MKNFKASSEEEMVFEFLKSECKMYDKTTQDFLLNKFINEQELNKKREKLLGQSRGFKNNERIFYCFPDYIVWYKAQMEYIDLKNTMLYPCVFLQSLSNDFSLETAKKSFESKEILSNDEYLKILENKKLFLQQETIDSIYPIILLSNKREYIVLEGNHRILSFALSNNCKGLLNCIIGYCSEKEFDFYKQGHLNQIQF